MRKFTTSKATLAVVTSLTMLVGTVVIEPTAAAASVAEPAAQSDEPNQVRVRLKKRNKLVDGADVKIKVTGYTGDVLSAVQCSRDSENEFSGRCRTLGFLNRPSRGPNKPFLASVDLARTIGETVDCFERNACDIRISGQGGEVARVGINFDKEAPSVAPALSMRPNRRLVDGQTVTVTVKNFAAQRAIAEVYLCDTDRNCGDRINTSRSYLTRRGLKFDMAISRFAGDTDCAAPKTPCELRVTYVRAQANSTETISLPLRFKKL